MTAKELKDKITFTYRDGEFEDTIVEARICYRATYRYNNREKEANPEMGDYIKDLLKEQIARAFYDDQGREMALAIREVERALPGSTEYFNAIDRLMELARYQEGKE